MGQFFHAEISNPYERTDGSKEIRTNSSFRKASLKTNENEILKKKANNKHLILMLYFHIFMLNKSEKSRQDSFSVRRTSQQWMNWNIGKLDNWT